MTLDLTGYKKNLSIRMYVELGDNEIEYHKEIGRLIDTVKFIYFITYGPLSRLLAYAAKRYLGGEKNKRSN